MKSILKALALAVLAIMVAVPIAAQATEKKAKNEVVMKMGNKVHLFHSGTKEAKEEIALNEVIPVYRESGKHPQPKEVGAVKVLSFIGDHYFEAEVVKGEIRVGDIAKKVHAGFLVQPAK
jgi:hypothetical protein